MTREEELTLALDLALKYLAQYEPPDSRAVSDAFVAMAAIYCNLGDVDCIRVMQEALAQPLPPVVKPELTVEISTKLD